MRPVPCARWRPSANDAESLSPARVPAFSIATKVSSLAPVPRQIRNSGDHVPHCCLVISSLLYFFTSLLARLIRISAPPSDRRASLAAREYMSRERPQQLIPVMRRLMLPRPSDGLRTISSKSGGSRGEPSLCPKRDQSRPPSFPVRRSDEEHQHALRRVP